MRRKKRGNLTYEADNRTLHYKYEEYKDFPSYKEGPFAPRWYVDLECCGTRQELNEMIREAAGKRWCSEDDLVDLESALDALLEPSENLPATREDGRFNVRQHLRKRR